MLLQVSFANHPANNNNHVIMSTIPNFTTNANNNNYQPPTSYISLRKNKLVNYTLVLACNSNTSFNSYIEDDLFLKHSPLDQAMKTKMGQLVNKTREEVRMEVLEEIGRESIFGVLKLIDNIQRLGIGYHFKEEIQVALTQLYETYSHNHFQMDVFNLHHSSLLFRLLRQHGFHISCEIFMQFLDENGKFKGALSSDIEGMLSLYEASHLRGHGDDILEEAFNFTTKVLNSMVDTIIEDEQLVAKVAYALECPIHKTVPRIDSRYFISQYENDPSHSKTILNFAKLDFNLLQDLHKWEIQYLTRWSYSWNVPEKLPYNVRDVIVAIYFCAFGAMNEHPQHSFSRIIYFKLLWVGTIIDDLYDILDIADLQLLTQAIHRWDKECVKQLPKNLKYIYTMMLDIYEEVEQQLADIGRSHMMHYIVQICKNQWATHLQTSKWCDEEYIPSFEDYMKLTSITVGGHFCIILSYLCLDLEENILHQVMDWAMTYPNVIKAFGIIARIEDDLAEDDPMKVEATQKPSAIGCYMKEYNITNKKEAYKELKKIANNAWKDINDSMLGPTTTTTTLPRTVFEHILNHARFLCMLSSNGDGFTSSEKTPMERNFQLLYKDPITIEDSSLSTSVHKYC